MRSFFFTLATIALVGMGAQSAAAFEVDQTTGNNNSAAARLGDPDDKIPYPHVADDGQPSHSNNLTAQPAGGNSGITFGFTSSGASAAEPDAFQRAQERMQQ